MQGLTHLLVSNVKGATALPTMGKYEECKIKLGSLLEDEDESGLELTLGLSLGGSKSKCSGKSGLNQRILKEAEEQKLKSAADYILKLSTKEQGHSNNIRETEGSAPVQPPWITLNKFVIPGHEQDGLLNPSVVSGPLERSSREEIADREDPRLYAQQCLKILQEKAVQSELPGGLESTNQITVHAAAAAATAAWAQFAPMGFSLPVYEKYEKGCEPAAAWVPGIIATSAGGDSSVILPNGVKPPAKLVTYPSLGAVDVVTNEKREGNRSVSLDRKQWQTMTQQQEMLERQRKRELHARQEARKKRRNLIDEQKQQKKLARSEDEKANSNSAKVCLQIPGSSAPKNSLQVTTARDFPNSQAGGESGIGFPSSTSPSSKVSSGWTMPPKKLERRQTSGCDDNEQLREIRRALVRERDMAAKEREMEAENRLIGGENGSRSSAEMALLQRMKGEQAATPLKTPVEAGVGPSIGETEDRKSNIEVWINQFFDSQKMMIDPQTYALAVAAFKNRTEDVRKETRVKDSITGRITEPVDCTPAEGQLISGISSSNSRVAGCEENRSNLSGDSRGTEMSGHEECQFITLGAATASTEMALASLPLPHSSFMHMQMPPSINVPISNSFGMPCSTPLPYPYFLQCVAPPSGGTQNLSPYFFGNFPLQMATPPGYSRFQLPAMELQAQAGLKLHPSVPSSHSLSASSAQKKSVTSTSDHESGTTQGMKVGQNIEVCKPVSTREPPKGGISALLRAASLNSAQGQVGTLARPQLPFAAPQSGSASPSKPAMGLMRTLSEPGEKCPRRGSDASPFASLVAAVEASQGLSAAVASVSKCSQAARRGLECSSSKGSFDAQDKVSCRSTQSKGSCELSCSDSIHKSPGFDESVEKKIVEQSRKGAVQNLEEAAVFAQEGATVRAGLAAGQAFGGTGSSPDLPWVSTTGTGPNGKTISGVLYRYVKGEVKILCACHGKHMTPREFVQHAGGVDVPNPEKSIVVNPFPFVGEAASVIG
ncbi:hypothetical protein O6H91_14G016900 [Diphasiastrum complanatum]|uniref:Uncharacterized protein n=2 Tax=Diphasiastrum complanatum TaxID=34168 RepID=A0ACC2BML4_DIPCM|nr:hypothetical protein O6H91_14G016900 [Diphasiastrum complanatum]KAJ7530739.1 hypothetical protein O6H91_14G016900 [Diphasiastrum complanatum]